MATGNKGLNQPAIGSSNWGDPLNDNADILDKALGEAVSFAVNAVVVPSTIPLVLAEYQCMTLIFNGAMTVDVTYEIPAGVAGQWVVVNNCTGVFDLTISSAAGGPELVMAQSQSRTVYTDGTSNGMIYCDTQAINTGTNGEVLVYNVSGVGAGSDLFTYDGTKLTIDAEDSGTTTAITALDLKRGSTGTPANGLGVGIDFTVETAVDDFITGGKLQFVVEDVTAASEDFGMRLELMAGGVLTEMMSLTSTGVFLVNSNAVITANQPAATQNLGTAGIVATATDDGTKSSGTYTPTPIGGNFRRIINGGAFTLAAPTETGDYSMIIQVTNNGSAGVITLSGFSKTSGFFNTTSGNDFFVYITKCNGFTLANVAALQ